MQTLAQRLAERAERLDDLAREGVDLLVVGGGIVGAAVAHAAAAGGARVALVERDDLASATTSASSKLIHGGLRYLRMGDVRLVREALREGRVLRDVVAPHLVHDLAFVLPVYAGGPYGRGSIRAALGAYGALAGGGRFRARAVPPAEAAALVPPLRLQGLRSAGVYLDAQTNDARLCLATARAAAEAGAAILTRVEAVAVEGAPGGLAVTVRDTLGEAVATIRARAVVNAAGAAVDDVRRLEDPAAGTSVSLSKGIHLLLPQPGPWSAALTIPVDKSRVSFALPWEGLLLLGTTDSAWEPGEPLEATPREEAQVLAEASRALPGELLRPDRVLARFAGLRVLPLTGGSTARARREVTLSRGPLGMVSVAGGKLTTHRQIALGVLAALRDELGPLDPGTAPLPGAADPAEVARELLDERPSLDPELARHLARAYGSLAGEVLACADAVRGGLEPIVSGGLDIVAQAVYARDAEWATTAEDVLRRRTTLALRGLASPATRARVEEALLLPAPDLLSA